MLIGATTLCIMTIMTIVSYLLVREYRSAEHDAARSALNIVQLINRDVRNTVEIYDSALKNLISVWQSKELSTLPPLVKHTLLFDRASEAPSNEGFFLLNAQGQVITWSGSTPRPHENFSEQPFFKVHASLNSGEVFISRPFQSNKKSDEWSISFSRRISAPDGFFLGVAMGQMRLDYFKGLFRGLDVGTNGNSNLISTDGFLLMQYPVTLQAFVGVDLSETPNFRRFLNERYGSFTAISGLYHQERLYNFSQVHDLPMVVVVALSTENIFSNWWHTTLLIGAATLLLCSGMLWLTWLLVRELRLRQHAERELAGLASTDALTGLANRRTLDATLEMDWRRSQRSGKPLTVMMIDIDHFKVFNDTYGHQKGDEALRQVAHVIKEHVRRPTDLAARYGGEEFAVVLNETDAASTRLLAEKIRHAVEQMEPVTADGKVLTISLGTCTRYAKASDSPLEIINTADKAMYQAKKGGRNRVVNINETGLITFKPNVAP